MKYRKLAFAALIGTTVYAHASLAHELSIADILKDRTLIGKVITVHSCMSLPMRADTDTSEEFVALYPCNRMIDESLTEVIFGKIESIDVAQPFVDANISFERRVEATFTGKLAFRPVEEGDTKKYLVLTIEKVSNPTEKSEPECTPKGASQQSCDDRPDE